MVWTSEKKKVDFIWQEIPKDGGTEGWQKLFWFFFLLRPKAFVVLRESKNFVSWGQLSWGRVKNFCPEGVRKHPRRTKIFHSPEGQLAEGNKILTLPRDNKGRRPKEKTNLKSFCHPEVPHTLVISRQIRATVFFSIVHTIFFAAEFNFYRSLGFFILCYLTKDDIFS